MKSKLTTEEQEAIALIQESRGISRKSAIRVFKKRPVTVLEPVAAAVKKAKAVKAVAPKVAVAKLTATEVSAARSEGVRLYKLANRPTKEQFIAAYGPLGPKMTWLARAKSAGLETAEEAALAMAKLNPKPVVVATPAEPKVARKGARAAKKAGR